MNYRERLLSRAAAVPRSGGEALFDPFAQVAAWLPEETAQSSPIAPASPPILPQGEPAARVSETVHHQPAPPAKSIRPQPFSASAASPAPERSAAAPAALTDKPGAVPPAVTPPDPLAIADAFFNEIAPNIARSPSRAATPAASDREPLQPGKQTAPAETPAVRAAPALPPAPPVRQQASRTVVPPKPAEAPLPRTAAQAARRSAPPTETRPAPQQPERARKPQPPLIDAARDARVIAVSSSAAPRSDLAHSLGILRFGIGQG